MASKLEEAIPSSKLIDLTYPGVDWNTRLQALIVLELRALREAMKAKDKRDDK